MSVAVNPWLVHKRINENKTRQLSIHKSTHLDSKWFCNHVLNTRPSKMHRDQ